MRTNQSRALLVVVLTAALNVSCQPHRGPERPAAPGPVVGLRYDTSGKQPFFGPGSGLRVDSIRSNRLRQLMNQRLDSLRSLRFREKPGPCYTGDPMATGEGLTTGTIRMPNAGGTDTMFLPKVAAMPNSCTAQDSSRDVARPRRF